MRKVESQNEAEFVVEKYGALRVFKRKVQALVFWDGYPKEDATWEPVENLGVSGFPFVKMYQRDVEEQYKEQLISQTEYKKQTLLIDKLLNELRKLFPDYGTSDSGSEFEEPIISKPTSEIKKDDSIDQSQFPLSNKVSEKLKGRNSLDVELMESLGSYRIKKKSDTDRAEVLRSPDIPEIIQQPTASILQSLPSPFATSNPHLKQPITFTREPPTEQKQPQPSIANPPPPHFSKHHPDLRSYLHETKSSSFSSVSRPKHVYRPQTALSNRPSAPAGPLVPHFLTSSIPSWQHLKSSKSSISSVQRKHIPSKGSISLISRSGKHSITFVGSGAKGRDDTPTRVDLFDFADYDYRRAVELLCAALEQRDRCLRKYMKMFDVNGKLI